MEKLYNRIDFHNDSVPALNESNLNAISKGLDDIDNRLIKVAGMVGNESGSGSNVEWNQIQEDGKKIAEITINGESTDVFAPEGSGSITRYGTTEEFEEIKDDPEIAEGTEYLITDDYVENSNDYSLDEVLIGKFLDKDLYRKLFETTQATTVNQTDFNDVVIPNAKLINIRFICETSSAQWVISGQGYLKSNGVLNARSLTASGSVIKTTIICEYVKVGA